MDYCTNPKCCHALTGNYIASFAREGRDLRALLLETGVPADAATSMVLEGKGNDVAVEVIDDRRGMVAMQEFKNGECGAAGACRKYACTSRSTRRRTPTASARPATLPTRPSVDHLGAGRL